MRLHSELFEYLNLFKNLIFSLYIASETTQLKFNKQSLTTSFDFVQKIFLITPFTTITITIITIIFKQCLKTPLMMMMMMTMAMSIVQVLSSVWNATRTQHHVELSPALLWAHHVAHLSALIVTYSPLSSLVAGPHISMTRRVAVSIAGNCSNCVNSVADVARSSTANDTGGSPERQHVTFSESSVTCFGRPVSGDDDDVC